MPVYHLLGGKSQPTASSTTTTTTTTSTNSRSLMESLYKEGLQPYAMDFRGFGGTPPDATNGVVPNRCVSDVESVLNFIQSKHATTTTTATTTGDTSSSTTTDPHYLPTLLGWSQGALVAQMVAQKSPHLISKLVLYGSIYDPLVCYPRSPLYVNDTMTDANVAATTSPIRKNTYNEAIEDFTVEGSIPPEPAALFAEAALLSDPIS